MTEVLIAAAVVGGVGILIGIFLGISGEKFKVEIDEKEIKVREALPGNNCGGCGFAGCDALAKAIVAGEAKVNQCPVGGEPVANVIAQILGVKADSGDKKVAFVKCSGTCDKTKDLYKYTGVETCEAMFYMQNSGTKVCTYGCMGLGSCVKSCEFDAIHIVDGIAVVDREKCKACGKCVSTCPKHLIELVPYDSKVFVGCNSNDKGPAVKKGCQAGCIGCMLCTKQCPVDAITVTNNLAHIDYDKCVNCGSCAAKCPAKVIRVLEDKVVVDDTNSESES